MQNVGIPLTTNSGARNEPAPLHVKSTERKPRYAAGGEKAKPLSMYRKNRQRRPKPEGAFGNCYQCGEPFGVPSARNFFSNRGQASQMVVCEHCKSGLSSGRTILNPLPHPVLCKSICAHTTTEGPATFASIAEEFTKALQGRGEVTEGHVATLAIDGNEATESHPVNAAIIRALKEARLYAGK